MTSASLPRSSPSLFPSGLAVGTPFSSLSGASRRCRPPPARFSATVADEAPTAGLLVKPRVEPRRSRAQPSRHRRDPPLATSLLFPVYDMWALGPTCQPPKPSPCTSDRVHAG